MQIAVAYSEAEQQIWMTLDVAEHTTVSDAIVHSGLLRQFPHIDLERQKVGVFGAIVKLDRILRAGDRVEIYRAITCDPQTVPRRDGEAAGEDD